MSKKQEEINFINNVLDEVKIYFTQEKPEVRLVVKNTNLIERFFISSDASNPLWMKILKKHDLSFRVLINKQRKPFVSIHVYNFIKTLFNLIGHNKLSNDIETVKKYFSVIEILII